MSNKSSNTKRMAKNSMALYVRMIVNIFINLYTSRVILDTLGVEDFGIYNLVGGIIAMLTFLNSSMSGATSRFLAFDIGQGDNEKLQKTYSTAIHIHIRIALIMLAIAETLGLWFVNTQLIIPEPRMFAANIVYQVTVISMFIIFVRVPFTASLMAHEDIDIYAYVEIGYTVLKLIIVYLLLFIPFDRLITYSGLLLFVNISIFIIYQLIVKRKYQECHYEKIRDKKLIKEMLTFSGWDLYGNGCMTLRQQGTNILINRFFGVTLNAASGIATQAAGVLNMFAANITTVFRPQIIKCYATKDFVKMQNTLSMGIIILACLIEALLLPLYLDIDSIMELWLKEVPDYAPDFCKLLLLSNAVGPINSLFVSAIHATGRIKKLSIVGGSLYLASLLVTIPVLYFVTEPVVAYLVWNIFVLIVLIYDIHLMHNLIPQIMIGEIAKKCLIPVGCLAIAIICSVIINNMIEPSILRFFITAVVNAVILFSLTYLYWFRPKYGSDIRKIFK